jgi:adenosylcobinamide-phosphate synthase
MEKELYRRGIVGALALFLDMIIERIPVRWSATAQAVVGLALARLPRRMPGSLGLWAEAGMLSTTLGLRDLRWGAGAPSAPSDEPMEGAAEAISQLADEANHKVVTPLCCYLVGGLPGPMLYRLVVDQQGNLGPRGAEIVGWLRAIPSRVTGALVVAAARLRGEDAPHAWQLLRQEGLSAVTPGQAVTRSALAGALNVELGDTATGGRPPTEADVGRAREMVRTAIALGAALMLAIPLLGRLRK